MRSLALVGLLFALVSCPTGGLFASQPAVRFGPHPLAAVVDGASPNGRLVDVNGILYGTTEHGGTRGRGTVFAVTTAGTERSIYNFVAGDDGEDSAAGLIDVNGVLYGTMHYGGKLGGGSVFAVTPAGKERVLHYFEYGMVDGDNPYDALIDVNGILYGTTGQGGDHNAGTVFSLTTAGDERILHNFTGKDGANPCTSLTDVNGVLYGTTYGGGKYGSGTFFSVTTSGGETVRHNFGGGQDGSAPVPDSLIDVNGVLYGTTYFGGKYGYGTVFSVTTAGIERVLYSFAGGEDGSNPFTAGLTYVNGVLYGTTLAGGKYGHGTVFAVTAAGKESVLHSFGGGEDGSGPVAGLIDVNGILYGTTATGGKYRWGTVFSITTSGAERVLYSFQY